MKYVMGIDSGGSKTICLVASENGDILSKGISGAGASVTPRKPMVKRSLTKAIKEACQKVSYEISCFEAVYVSLGGLNTAEVEKIVGNLIKTKKVFVRRESSGEIIFSCASLWGFNIAVIAGTGSIAFGIGNRGTQRVVGGWGHIIDDRGSGYAIGRDALQAIAELIDNRRGRTSLLSVICSSPPFSKELLKDKGLVNKNPKNLSYQERLSIKEAIKRSLPKLDRYTIAQLTPLVIAAAQTEDETAIQILQEAGRQLGLLVNTLISELRIERQSSTVIGIGGIFRSSDIVWDSFRKEIKKFAPKVKVIDSDFELVLGATLLALRKCGINLDKEVVQRVRNTYKKVIHYQ